MKNKKQNFTNFNKGKVVSSILKNVVGISLLVFVTSCNPKEDIQPTLPDGAALNQRFDDNKANAVQEFTIDASVGGVITGTQGTKVTFPPNSFGLNGTPVTGNVTVKLIEIYDKASMLLKDKSTLGMHANGDKEALKSAGEFFINAEQDTNNLELLEMASVESRPVDFADLDGGMQVFRGDDATNGDWVEADEDGDGEKDNPQIKDGGGANGVSATYNYDIGDFGWTNLDRWYSFTGPKTQLYIDVPDGFDQNNCAVYLSYDGEPTALARMDIWDTSLQMFTEHYGMIPIGQQVHIIMVAEINGQLNYAIQGTIIVDQDVEVITSLSPITQPALEALINGLP
jgi:hypothetical protein